MPHFNLSPQPILQLDHTGRTGGCHDLRAAVANRRPLALENLLRGPIVLHNERAGAPCAPFGVPHLDELDAWNALEKLARLAADPRRSQMTGGMIRDLLGHRAQWRGPEAGTGEKLRNMPHLFRDGLRPAAVLV